MSGDSALFFEANQRSTFFKVVGVFFLSVSKKLVTGDAFIFLRGEKGGTSCRGNTVYILVFLLQLGMQSLRVQYSPSVSHWFSSYPTQWLHLHEHIDLGIQYDPSTGIYGMNLFVVLERLGYRAGLRSMLESSTGLRRMMLWSGSPYICCFIYQDDTRHNFGHSWGFICPFVPLLPIACILINVYLLVNLGSATWTRVSIWLVMGTLVYGFYGRRHSSLQDAIYVPAADVDEIYGSFSHCSDGLGVVILAVCISNSEFASCSGWWSLPECRISDHPWHEDTAFSCTATKLNTVAPLGTHSWMVCMVTFGPRVIFLFFILFHHLWFKNNFSISSFQIVFQFLDFQIILSFQIFILRFFY